MIFLKAETMPLVSFVFPIAPFTVLQQRVGVQYMLWNDILSDPSLAWPKIKFLEMEQS
jgi:hypothetical protein